MTSNDIRSEIVSVLTRIAPEVDPGELKDDALLRDQVDLDSMDWLNFLIGVHERLHVTVAERDYATLRTLADVVHYVEEHAGRYTP